MIKKSFDLIQFYLIKTLANIPLKFSTLFLINDFAVVQEEKSNCFHLAPVEPHAATEL